MALEPKWPPAADCDPALAALFTPPRPILGHYAVCTTPAPFGAVIASGGPDEGADGPGGFHFSGVEAINPLDAFGTAGPYDRSRLARLYGGLRANVIRGWRQDAGRFRAVTLISPYPDPALMRLRTGTMVIVFTLSRSPVPAR